MYNIGGFCSIFVFSSFVNCVYIFLFTDQLRVTFWRAREIKVAFLCSFLKFASGETNNKLMSGVTTARALVQQPAIRLVYSISPTFAFITLSFDLNQTCSVCQDIFVNPVQVLPCCHCFCEKCILSWEKRNSSCPLCRGIVSFQILDFY